ncbi:hypothetical protein [Veillonella caviae]|uniref:hypothetical protein n=1 Tax=Veillonella caviae TaxID=248316 RepID=UPI0023572B8B|nr:hypothetical protein [Veillonella caviae]
MSINSRAKGARGERLWRNFCKEQGFENVRRTVQYCGNTGDASDCVGLPNIHQEVKCVEALNIQKAMEQAIHDSGAKGDGEIPIVAHKRKYKEWLITMRAEDWFKLYRQSKESK